MLLALTAGEAFTPPAYCNRSFLEVTHAEPVTAKRYAVVLNRHCYRGFSGIDYRNKDSYVGTQRAVDMQLALINSVLGNVILPLEHLGFEVDVFLVAHDPAPHNATKSNELWDLLIRAFGGRVVATKQLRGLRALGGDGGRDLGQGTAMVETFRLLEKHSIKLASQNYFPHNESRASPYRAVLINRFDVAFTDRLGPADRADLEKTNYPTDAAHYALWSAKRPSFVMNMIASIPGWLLGCYLSHALHSPDMARDEWWTEKDGRFWHPQVLEDELKRNNKWWGLAKNPFPSRDGFFIYRGPYGISHHDGGKFICRWLREYYGGPSCGVTYVAGDTCAHAGRGRRDPTPALKALYKLAPEEDAARAEELGKLLKRRPEWNLEPRPDEAVPPSLEAFLAAVACGDGEADTIRDLSAKDGFLINTSPPQTNEQKERKKERKCVKPQCAKIVE